MEEKEKISAEYEETNVEVAEAEDLGEEAPNPNRLPPNVVELKNRWWIRYLITAGVLAVLTVLTAWARGVFVAVEQKDLLSKLSDAFFVTGTLSICFGLIIVVSNGGVFDMLAYSIRSLFRLFKKDPLDRKYGGYYGYRQARKERNRSFWYLVIVGAIYLAVGVSLFVWYFLKYRR